MVSACRNFKNIFSRPLFTIICRLEMLKFHPYSILTGVAMVGFVIFHVLKNPTQDFIRRTLTRSYKSSSSINQWFMSVVNQKMHSGRLKRYAVWWKTKLVQKSNPDHSNKTVQNTYPFFFFAIYHSLILQFAYAIFMQIKSCPNL